MAEETTFKDFQKLDLRIGTVIEATIPDWSHWVMKLKVDFGDPPAGAGQRIIFAGLMHFYQPKELVGKQFAFVVNMKPKKIGPEGDLSQGMMLAADGKLLEPIEVQGEKIFDKPVLFHPTETVPPGTKIR